MVVLLFPICILFQSGSGTNAVQFPPPSILHSTRSIVGFARSLKGGLQINIQTASHVKKNIAPLPNQFFFSNSAISILTRGYRYLRLINPVIPIKKPNNAWLIDVRAKDMIAMGIAYMTVTMLLLAFLNSLFKNSSSSNSGALNSYFSSFSFLFFLAIRSPLFSMYVQDRSDNGECLKNLFVEFFKRYSLNLT